MKEFLKDYEPSLGLNSQASQHSVKKHKVTIKKAENAKRILDKIEERNKEHNLMQRTDEKNLAEQGNPHSTRLFEQ